jgi:hypothetical protein
MEGRAFLYSLLRRDPGNPTTPSSIQITPTVKIALIAGGGGLALLIVIIVVWCVCRRKRKKNKLPAAQTPVTEGFFNPDALPTNPLPQRQASDAYRPAITAPTVPNGATFPSQASLPLRQPSPQPPASFDASSDLSQRRGNQGPTPLKLNTHLRAPSGVGMERVNAAAWGMNGRHLDKAGNYYGSMANQGGQVPMEKALPQVPAIPAAYQQQQQQQPAVYGDDDVYASRAEQMDMLDRYNTPQPQQQPDRYATPQPGRYATPQPDRYQTPQPNRYNTPQPQRYNTPQAAPAAAGGNPYRQDMGNPYAMAANQQRAYEGYGAGGYEQRGQHGYDDAYDGYGAGRYGHSRQVSDETERAPTGWI